MSLAVLGTGHRSCCWAKPKVLRKILLGVTIPVYMKGLVCLQYMQWRTKTTNITYSALGYTWLAMRYLYMLWGRRSVHLRDIEFNRR